MILSSEGSLSAGDQISGDEFLLTLSAFSSVFQEDITSTAITALLVTLTRVTVEMDEEKKTELTFFQDQLKNVSQRVEMAITFYQDQFEDLAGETATETQMKTGDPSASLFFMSSSKIVKLETLSKNKYLMKSVRMLCESIGEDAMEATSSGTMDMTVEELNELVMEFLELISQDFLSSESSGSESTYANDLVIKIQSAKLTAALAEAELTMVEFIVGRLVNLETELEGAIQVFFFQYTLITGNSLEIQVKEVPCELPSMMMTTRNPGSMMTTMSSSMIMTTQSHGMMTTARPSMMTTTGSMLMMTTKSSGFVTNQMVEIDVEVCVRGETRSAWSRFGYNSKRREWLKNAMKNAFKKHF